MDYILPLLPPNDCASCCCRRLVGRRRPPRTRALLAPLPHRSPLTLAPTGALAGGLASSSCRAPHLVPGLLRPATCDLRPATTHTKSPSAAHAHSAPVAIAETLRRRKRSCPLRALALISRLAALQQGTLSCTGLPLLLGTPSSPRPGLRLQPTYTFDSAYASTTSPLPQAAATALSIAIPQPRRALAAPSSQPSSSSLLSLAPPLPTALGSSRRKRCPRPQLTHAAPSRGSQIETLSRRSSPIFF